MKQHENRCTFRGKAFSGPSLVTIFVPTGNEVKLSNRGKTLKGSYGFIASQNAEFTVLQVSWARIKLEMRSATGIA